MAESSTPNPFKPDLPREPDDSNQETEHPLADSPKDSPDTVKKLRPILPEETESKPQKLKLKSILTPLSPHLTAPRPEPAARVPKEKPFTPSPQAVPVEPEPELTEEELAAREQALGIKPEGPAAEIETSPPTKEELGLEPEQGAAEESAETEAAKPAEKKAARKTTKPTQPKAKSRKLVFALLVPVVLIVAIAALVNYLLDPLGLKIQPIEELPDLTLLHKTDAAPSDGAAFSDTSQLLEALEGETIAGYLSILEEKATFSATESGVFINAVFFKEGSVVNPRYGLTLVTVDSQSQSILLEDADGQDYRIGLR